MSNATFDVNYMSQATTWVCLSEDFYFCCDVNVTPTITIIPLRNNSWILLLADIIVLLQIDIIAFCI